MAAELREQESIIGAIYVAWFRPDEWNQLKLICPDLQETYAEWLASAEAGIAAYESPLKEQIVKVILTVDELRNWKRSTGRKIDGRARMRLALKIGYKRNSTRH